MAELTRHGAVFVLDIGNGTADDEHRLDPDRIAAVNRALDQVEATTGPAALVTTASGKFFSNGLEPALFGSPDAVGYLDGYQRLLARLVGLELPTVAAVRGHVYAGGLLFALAHDERVMRVDRGFACLPEVQLGLPLLAGMVALVRARLDPAVAHDVMCTGRRYPGPEAARIGLVGDAVADERVLPVALARAQELAALRGPAHAAIKRALHADVISKLTAPVAA